MNSGDPSGIRLPLWEADHEDPLEHLGELLTETFYQDKLDAAYFDHVKRSLESANKPQSLRGFVILNDDNEENNITPTDPIKRDDDGKTYQLGYMEGPTGSGEKEVPLVTPFKPEKLMGKSSYSYKAFTYQELKETTADEKPKVYLFTGGYESAKRVAIYITPNTFFRRDDLLDRLCGLPSKRLQKYQSDWLLALETMSVIDKEKFPNNLVTTAPGIFMKSAWDKAIESYADFPLWDTNGNLVDAKKYKSFFSTLFSPSGNDFELLRKNPKFHLSEFIFGRFCKLLYAATVSPQSDWDVTARYWNSPVQWANDTNRRVRFYYHLPTRLAACFDKNDKANWEAIIRKGHEEALSEIVKEVKSFFLPAPFSTDDSDTFLAQEPSSGFDKLGTHPQGFYTIYVLSEDWNKMKAAHIRPSGLVWPGVSTVTTRLADQKYRDIKNYESQIEACVTENKIKMAQVWGRTGGQAQLMNKTSATQVARAVWNEEDRFEWLHRCAYSFGGLGDSNSTPDTSQDPINIVFGTAEANTTMMRYESYIKRLARTLKVEVKVITKVVYPGEENKAGKLYWIVPTLHYEWALNGGPSKVVNIPLLSRCRPTLFEAKLDKKVDHLLAANKSLCEKLFSHKGDDEDLPLELPSNPGA